MPRDLLANVTRWWALPAKDNEDKSLSWDGDLSRLDIVLLVDGRWYSLGQSDNCDLHWPVGSGDGSNLISFGRLALHSTLATGLTAHLR